MVELIKLVKGWSIDRGLSDKEPSRQVLKLVEEVGELCSAISKGEQGELLDALGDIQVVLIILHQQLGLELENTLGLAYDEIKNRTGRTENGIFIKDNK